MKIHACLLIVLAIGLPMFAAGEPFIPADPGTMERFKQLDKDKNRKLSGNEFWPDVQGKLTDEQAVALFVRLDKNKDKSLDDKEYVGVKAALTAAAKRQAEAKKKAAANRKKPTAKNRNRNKHNKKKKNGSRAATLKRKIFKSAKK